MKLRLAAALAATLAALVSVSRTASPSPHLARAASGAVASSSPWTVTRLVASGGRSDLRVGVRRPEGTPVADVLYLPGFGDRFDDHGPLFEALLASGFRVVSFDYPSHGETTGRGLDGYDFAGLASLAAEVEGATLEDPARPLGVVAWSTGGLLAVRMAQGLDREERRDAGGAWFASFASSASSASSSFRRPVVALALLSPGVAVRPLVGELGFVTQRTLTRNSDAPVAGPIAPLAPAFVPVFAARLLASVALSWKARMPAALPTLLVWGGEREDRYVVTSGVRGWAREQRARGADLTTVACDGGFHELDNEPEPMGGAVREAVAAFLAASFAGAPFAPPASGACVGRAP